jgi:hypothetical protein
MIPIVAAAFAIVGAIYAFYRWGIDFLKKILTPREQITYKQRRWPKKRPV